MDRLVIRGGNRIEGSVQICGAKNAVLPQIAAALLGSGRLQLGNVPEVTDVDTMLAMMREFGVVASRGPGRTLVLDAGGARNAQAPYDMVRRMRASILVLAPLLARFGSARVSLPGGCAIGARPIDLHLKALDALGADVDIVSGYIHARTKGDGLRGARVVLSSPSVGATETALMAAVLARGESEILNAARDPEVSDLALCLSAMGARIQGVGTHRILVQGVDALHDAHHDLITDRIEAGTYAIAAAITGGHLEILGAHLEHLGRLGANISLQGSTALVRGVERLHGAEVMATDLRASVSLVLAALVAEGETTVHRIYHLDRGYESLDRKLVQCGADIRRVEE